MIEIDECAIGPETLPEFLTGDHLAGPLDQREEELEGTLLEFDADAVLAELACTGLYREFPGLKLRDRIR